LADVWRWPIRQSATPFRVADERRTMMADQVSLWITFLVRLPKKQVKYHND
jgi:hypothetical protein